MTLVSQTLLRISLVTALAVGLVLGDGLHSGASSASAQDVHVSGALAGADAVKKLRLWREMRLHVEPFFAFTVGDEYSRSLIVGGEVRFHFLDWLGIGGWGGYSVAKVDTNLTKEIQAKGVTERYQPLEPAENVRTSQSRSAVSTGGPAWSFTSCPSAGSSRCSKRSSSTQTWTSSWARLSSGLKNERTPYRPTISGGHVHVLRNRGEPDGWMRAASEASLRAPSARRSRRPFGVAFNAFFHDFLGIALRWRGIPFKYNTGGTDNNRDNQIDSNDRIRQFNNMFSVGLIFVLAAKDQDHRLSPGRPKATTSLRSQTSTSGLEVLGSRHLV